MLEGYGTYSYHLRTWEMKAELTRVQDHPQSHNKFKVIRTYMGPSPKNPNKQN